MPTTYAQKQAPAQKMGASSAASVLDVSSQSEGLQRKADMANNAAQREEAPRPNNTGMPDNLKSGIESLSGFSMDDVRVHYNSSKPATVQALAYTQGTDIHVAPGQEKHLPHEAWHVAQQMAGRVSPTTNINGMPVNDNAGLEHEADVMGEKAVQCKCEKKMNIPVHKKNNNCLQLYILSLEKKGGIDDSNEETIFSSLNEYDDIKKVIDFYDDGNNPFYDTEKKESISRQNEEFSRIEKKIEIEHKRIQRERNAIRDENSKSVDWNSFNLFNEGEELDSTVEESKVDQKEEVKGPDSPNEEGNVDQKEVNIDGKIYYIDVDKLELELAKRKNSVNVANFSSNNYWVSWPVNCTGDLPSMSAAILMGLPQGGIKACQGNDGSEPTLNSLNVAASYLGCSETYRNNAYDNDGIVRVTRKPDIKESNIKFQQLTRYVAEGCYGEFNKGPEFSRVAGGCKEEDISKIKKTWFGNVNFDYIGSFLNKCYNFDRKYTGGDIEVLWIRTSGENGGIHYENDTSFNALSLYIKKSNKFIILAGDDKKDGKRGESKAGIIAENKNVLNLTKFWEKPEWKEIPNANRTSQFAVYDYIKTVCEERGNKLKHIGSMSGGLEALALIGHDVDFKGKEGDPSVKRELQYEAQSTKNSVKYRHIKFFTRSDLKTNGYEKRAAKYYSLFTTKDTWPNHAELLKEHIKNFFHPSTIKLEHRKKTHLSRIEQEAMGNYLKEQKEDNQDNDYKEKLILFISENRSSFKERLIHTIEEDIKNTYKGIFDSTNWDEMKKTLDDCGDKNAKTMYDPIVVKACVNMAKLAAHKEKELLQKKSKRIRVLTTSAGIVALFGVGLWLYNNFCR